MKFFLKKYQTSLLLLFYFVFFGINGYTQMNPKEADSLKVVLRNTKEKQPKNELIFNILTNTFNTDSIRHYINLGIENSKNSDNEWYAKYIAMDARHYYSKDRAQFYKQYKKALSLAKSKETKAYIYRTLAFKYHIIKQNDSLRFYLDKIIAEQPEDTKINIEIFYLEGAFYADNKDYSKAIIYYQKAIDMAITTGNTKQLYLYYHKLSFAFFHTGGIDKAIQTLETCLKKTRKDTYEYGRTYELMAGFTGQLNPNDSIALVYKELAINAYLNGKIENELIAIGYKNLAKSYLNFNKLDKAFEAIQKVKAYNKISEPAKSMIIDYHLILAEYYEKKQVLDSAEVYLKKSIDLTENEKGLLKRFYYKTLIELGKVSIKKNDLILATEYFLKIANESEYKDTAADHLYSIYKSQKNYKTALVWLEKSFQIKDSLAKNEKEFALEKFKVQFNTKEKENELLKISLENSKKDKMLAFQNTKITIVVIISILTIILLYLFFYVRKNRKQLTLKLELENQKEITQVKNKIIENLSHEIRTPISVINGYLDLISQNSLYPNKIIEFVKIGDRNLKLLIENLNNFLALQKIDENNIFPDTKKKKNLNLFFKNTVDSFAANAQLKNIGLHYTSNLKDDLKVDYEYHKLEKIVNNLINNALKFTEPGKDIYVKVILDKSHLHFIVKDEGKGISKEEQQFIFDRFYQSKNNNETGGFGIGLALVKSIVESMNGNIVLKSEENMGTIFEIALPITKIENIDLYLKPEEHNIISFNKVVAQEITNISNFPKVLIVDDNVEMTNYLYTLLNSFLDCTIVYNGKEALKKIEKTKYDLIISDYKMPIMDGKTLKATLNKVKEFETIPFIMLTATPVANFASLGLTLGINDYIIKPFSNNELIARIRTILENKLLQIKIQNKDTNIQFDGYTSELIEKVNVLVLKNLENPNFNVLDLANACGYGQKQFGRIIKAKTGMTAVNLILEIKLLKAYELLQINTFSTIKEVMYTIGLTNRSYFNKAFFKRFGVKPSELIKKYSNT